MIIACGGEHYVFCVCVCVSIEKAMNFSVQKNKYENNEKQENGN